MWEPTPDIQLSKGWQRAHAFDKDWPDTGSWNTNLDAGNSRSLKSSSPSIRWRCHWLIAWWGAFIWRESVRVIADSTDIACALKNEETFSPLIRKHIKWKL